MSAIAGFCALDDGRAAAAECRALLDRQAIYGPHSLDLAEAEGAALGRCLRRSLDEDRFDRQPLRSRDGRFLLVADVRLDDREALWAAAGGGAGELGEIADSEILLRAWERFGRDLPRRILGDFAFAVWDGAERSLFLARDTAGERPLHYRLGRGWFAFASLPHPLASLSGPARVDAERLARFVGDLPPRGPESFFAEVARVEPGHMVALTAGGAASRSYWEPRFAELRLPRIEDYGEALRSALDVAVRRRLRRAGGSVAAHLSSGLDSGLVATSAARTLAPGAEALHAFTSAPRLGYDGAVPTGWCGDESEAAAAIASRYANIEHAIVRDGPEPLGLLPDLHRLSGQPVGHVCNNAWWQAVHARAAAVGASVLLTGEAGNFTLTAGLGVDTLPDFLRSGALSRWWREARALHRRGRYTAAQIANASLGPWVPAALYRALRGTGADTRFVHPDRRAGIAALHGRQGWLTQPQRSSYARRLAMLRLADPGNFRKANLARWGVEERDPTADRDLVELCFSLPPEAFLRNGARRPALRAAFGDRLPAAAFDPPLRGYQMADWHERFSGEAVRDFAARLAREGAAADAVDWDEVAAAARAWPAGGYEKREIIYSYRGQLMRALAAADFAGSASGG